MTVCDMLDKLYENHDTFKEYGLDQYMSSVALSVHRKYRGRGIGDQFLISR